MWKKILFSVLALVAILAVVISMQPADFHVERSIVMKASSTNIYTEINDLRKWNAWSPWAKLDPAAKTEFSGPWGGVGQKMVWDGNSDIGAGEMTIIESRPFHTVVMRLDFKRPMEGTSTSGFSIKEENGQSNVTWYMDGHNDFIGKAISLVYDCEKMIGEKYEEGLASLKAIAEAK